MIRAGAWGGGLLSVGLLFVAPAWSTCIDRACTVVVEASRGVDPTVDYGSLVFFGPWDDRNYQLHREDLSLLAADEAAIREPLPAFFRVALRRARPELARAAARYPLHGLNVFRQRFGGYLVEGRHYRRATRHGGRYWVDLSRTVEDGNAPKDDGLASGDVRVTDPNSASEAAIAISPIDTRYLVAGSIGPDDQVRMHYSTDGGGSWTQSELPLGATCCDPSVEWSADGTLAYATALAHCGLSTCDLLFYRSADGGASWSDLENDSPGNPIRTISQLADREFMHVDRHDGSPYRDSIYLTFHEANVLHFARSSDFGNDWSGVAFSSADEELGIAGDITTDRAGRIYFAWPAYISRTIRLRTSDDGGVSFSDSSVVATTQAAYSFPLPSQEIREVGIYLSAAADLSDGPYAGSIYLAWSDTLAPSVGDPAQNHARVRVAFSRDGGASWAITTPHETDDAMQVDRWQPSIAVGGDGTVHVVFYDTRQTADRSGVDLYYAFSTDGGASWSAPRRVTTTTSPNIEDVFEFGDYAGADFERGELMAIYTDNRNENAGSGDSVDIYASGITPGGALRAPGAIPGGRGVPGAPLTVAKVEGSADLSLQWETVCGAGSDYAIYEGRLGQWASKLPVQCSTGGSTSATITPAPSGRFYLVVARNADEEGSYGQASDRSERRPDPGACLVQRLGGCP